MRYSGSSFVGVLMAMEAEVLMDDLLITRERKKASMDAPSTFDSRVASIAVREVKSTDVVIATVAASTEYSLSGVIAFWRLQIGKSDGSHQY